MALPLRICRDLLRPRLDSKDTKVTLESQTNSIPKIDATATLVNASTAGDKKEPSLPGGNETTDMQVDLSREESERRLILIPPPPTGIDPSRIEAPAQSNQMVVFNGEAPTTNLTHPTSSHDKHPKANSLLRIANPMYADYMDSHTAQPLGGADPPALTGEPKPPLSRGNTLAKP